MASFNMGVTHDITKSDTANDKFNWVMVTGTAGTIEVGQQGGNNITLSNVPVGVWVPVGKATNIKVASTAVGIMVV